MKKSDNISKKEAGDIFFWIRSCRWEEKDFYEWLEKIGTKVKGERMKASRKEVMKAFCDFHKCSDSNDMQYPECNHAETPTFYCTAEPIVAIFEILGFEIEG